MTSFFQTKNTGRLPFLSLTLATLLLPVFLAGASCAQKKEENNMLWLLLLLGGGGGGGGGGGSAGSATSEETAGGESETTDGGTPTVSYTSDPTVNHSNQSSFTLEGECSEENRNVALSGAVIATGECLSGVWSITTDLAWMPSGRFIFYLDHSSADGTPAARVEAVLEKNTLDEDATALYKFEDASDIGHDDSLSGDHDAQKVSALTITDDAERGNSLNLDGAAGEFQINDGKFFNDEFNARTITFWARPRDIQNPRMLFDEGGSTNGLAFRIENGEAILSVRNGGTGSQTDAVVPLTKAADEWVHLGAQFDRGSLRLFVDGVPLEVSTGYSIVKKHSDVGGLGRRYKSDAFGNRKGLDVFDGLIDHFAVYDKALSANEVGMLAGLTPDPETITPPGPLDVGLAAFYEFETKGDLGKDSQGGHPATPSSVKQIDDPDRGKVARFKTDSQFLISDGSYLNDAFDERSVALWFRPKKTGTRQVLFDEGGATNGLTIKIEGNRLFAAVRAGGANSQHTLSAALDNGADIWYHTLVVFDKGELKLYLNGAYQTLDTGYTTIPAHGNTGGAGARHGNSDAFDEKGTDGFNKGLIDDLRIYSRALGDTEAELLSGQTPAELIIDPLETGLVARYAFDDAADPGLDSFGGHTITPTAVTVENDLDRGSVGRFDGATSNFQLSDGKFLNDAFTARSLSLWFKPTDVNTLQVLLDEGGTTNGLTLTIEAGDLHASVRDSKKQVDLSATLTDGADNWYHAVVIFDAGDFTLYLNGTSTTATAAYNEVSKHGDAGGLGARYGGGDARGNPGPAIFNGDLDDVRIYSRALSGTEVDTLGDVTDSINPLAAYLAPALNGSDMRMLLITTAAVMLALGMIHLWRRRKLNE